MTLVSVVVPAKNRPAAVADAVRSMFAGTYQDFEMFVVDQTPNESTRAALMSFAADDRFNCIQNRSGRPGPASSRNIGIALSNGEIVAHIDDDVTVKPNWRANSVCFTRKHNLEEQRMTMPNFFVIGAAKSGTDSLCAYLGQHPQVYMCSNREPSFFVAEGQEDIPYRGPQDREVVRRWDMWVSTLERYQALFADVTTEKAIGEGSTWYLYDTEAPMRIHRHIPHARLIAILRNPVDRAYSAYTMLIRDGRETTWDFSQALAAEDERVRATWEPLWHYRRMGFYYAQLKRYYDTFDAGQIRVVLYDDFNARPGEVLRDLFGFLEVDDRFEPDTSLRQNVSMVPKNIAYHTLVVGQNPLKTIAKAVLPIQFRWRVKERLAAPNFTRPVPIMPEVRRELIEIFRPDILRLQDMLDRDLSHWLQ